MGAKPIGVSDVRTKPPQLAVQGVSKRFGGVTAVGKRDTNRTSR